MSDITSLLLLLTPSDSQAWKKADISGQWAQTAWAKKLAAKKVRANLTDFQRFQVRITKAKVRYWACLIESRDNLAESVMI